MPEKFPSFEEFFTAIHGHPPFPWQGRLADQVLSNGWPALLDLPTGVGKTTSLDIALYCLAAKPETNPRRALIVVDRRVVVDQGAHHARSILSAMATAPDGPARVVADKLRSLWSAPAFQAPFAVAVLRGGMPMDNDWARRPDQPVLGVSTVDQVGSRLLFRGYGVGPQSVSIHAGLMGTDTLLLLDEVHLSVPFAETVEAVRRFQTPVEGLPSCLRAVRMSATPGATTSTPFRLDDTDRRHPVLAKRLGASKRARLEVVKATGRDEKAKCRRLAEEAVAQCLGLLSDQAKVIGIVVNRVDTARFAAEILADTPKAPKSLLVTGRMRPLDRDRVVRDILVPRAGAGRDRAADEPLVVIATQCIEAGADLDFDGIVTECASLDALRQRFGRVDRRGQLGNSQSVILCRSDLAKDADDAVYGLAMSKTWEWLEAYAEDGDINFGVSAMDAYLKKSKSDPAGLMPLPHHAPVMLPAHIESFAQTSPRPLLEQDLSLWLHGPEKESNDVQVVWRARVELSYEAIGDTIERLICCRPSSLESLSLPVWAARKWLSHSAGDMPEIADATMATPDGDGRQRRQRTEENVVAIRWNGPNSRAVVPSEIQPGDVLVVDCSVGGVAMDSFNPDARSEVTDLSALAAFRGRGIASVWLDAGIATACGLPIGSASDLPTPIEDESTRELKRRVGVWLTRLPALKESKTGMRPDEWVAAKAALQSRHKRISIVGGIPFVESRLSEADRGRLCGDICDDMATEAEYGPAADNAITLRVHSERVRDLAKEFAANLGLSPAVAKDVSIAAWMHDIGKADPRFQQLLVGGSEIEAALLEEPLAKSAMSFTPSQRSRARTLAGYPIGYRHELVSAGLLRERIGTLSGVSDPDLVLHLVASHHGWCRPFAPAVADGSPVDVVLQHDDVTFTGRTDHGLEKLSSGTAERYWSLCDRYGWWGVALLETIVRLADHRASEMEAEGINGRA